MCYLSWTLVGIKTDFIFYTFLLQVDMLLPTLFVSHHFELLLFYFYYRSFIVINHVAKMSCRYVYLEHFNKTYWEYCNFALYLFKSCNFSVPADQIAGYSHSHYPISINIFCKGKWPPKMNIILLLLFFIFFVQTYRYMCSFFMIFILIHIPTI